MDEKTKNKKREGPKPPKKITERYLYNAGLHYLKRYTASTAHFRFIMNRKIKKSCAHHTEQSYDECQKNLDQAIEKFIELGFLNDDQYTFGMVNSYRKRGVSKKAIIAKLQQKGLAQDLILEKLDLVDEENQNHDQDAELTAAIRHAQKKKIGPFSKKEQMDEKEIRRALGSFARAGFSYDIASKVMEMAKADQ